MKSHHKRKRLATAMAVSFSMGISGLAAAKSLPVYHVIESGVGPDRAYELAKSLGIGPELLDRDALEAGGEIRFVDSHLYQYVPTRKLGAEKSDEDYQEVIAEALDFEAIAQIKPVDQDRVMRYFQDTLKDLGMAPSAYRPVVSNTRFTAVDVDGEPMADALLDTSARLNLVLNDLPLVGPGAKIAMTVGPDGQPTRLQYAVRELVEGEAVPIIDRAVAEKRCATRYLDASGYADAQDLELDLGLVYYAPALSGKGVETIQPHYSCGGTARVGDEVVHLLRELIPAVDSPAYVPTVRLQAAAEGDTVHASLSIDGGLPPYRIDWNAAHPKQHDDRGTAISYQVRHRQPSDTEAVVATVTDANGIQVVATRSVPVYHKPVTRFPALLQKLGTGLSGLLDGLVPTVEAVGGVSDYGTENAVTNEFGDLEQGFIDRMQSAGIVERFSWSGTSAWEQDFKAPEDSSWIDNTDITFYVGHGYGGGFTFENTSNDDGTLDYDDATEDWGDKDLEWLALLSCQVLKQEWSGMSRFDRWKQEFDGLHLLLGFHTNAYAWSSFSGEFADNMLKGSPLSVRQSWFEATDTNQPDGVVPVAMGVFRYDGTSNMNDYFWGKGSVGPDIHDGDIGGYWTISVN